jgi:hypothetical protein
VQLGVWLVQASRSRREVSTARRSMPHSFVHRLCSHDAFQSQLCHAPA